MRRLFIAVLCFHFLALLLFKNGFLLTRTVLERPSKEFVKQLSSRIDSVFPDMLKQLTGHVTAAAASARQREKVVIVLIDALRFDFVASQPGSTEIYHNIMTSITDKLDSEPRNSHLFHFIADPPTTTMQRLKALMTGSLPTFIDAGSNFASGKVLDDHLLRRLNETGQRMIFMGDDTWMNLYESDLFAAAYPYPSFEVFDLHTVDNGCLEKIWQYIGPDKKDDDWSMLVSHFLGVDHVGHRYQPDHFEMTNKLRQLNSFLKQLFERIDDRTTVFVVGDHGMDRKGDHGGDTNLEIDAAAFVYSKRPIFAAGLFDDLQIKLPYSNQAKKRREPHRSIWDRLANKMEEQDVGQFETTPLFDQSYPSIFQIDLVPTIATLLKLEIPFGSLGMSIPQMTLPKVSKCPTSHCPKSSELKSVLVLIDTMKSGMSQVYSFVRYYFQHTGDLRDVLDFWEKHVDILSLKLKAVKLGECFAKNTCDSSEEDSSVKELISVAVEMISILRNSLEKCRDVWARFDMAYMVSGVFFMVLICLYLLFNLLIMLDTVKKDRTLANHLTISAVVLLFNPLIFASNSYIIFEDSVVFYLMQSMLLYLFISSKTLKSAFGFLLSMCIARFTFTSTICREEQLPRCTPTFYSFAIFSNPLTHLKDTLLPWALIALLFLFLIIMPRIIGYVMNMHIRERQRIGKYARLQAAFLFVFLHWFFEALDEHKTGYFGVILAKIICARLAFAVAAISIVVDLYDWFRNSKTIPFSLPLNMFLIVLSVQLPPGVWILSLGFLQLLFVTFAYSNEEHGFGLIHALILCLLGKHQFFSTGHQATFSSIQFQTGFIGLESFDFILSGGMVVLNSMGPFVVFISGLSTLIYFMNAKYTDKILFKAHLRIMLLICSLYYSLMTFTSLLFTCIFRRHLMVWNVFAPRFMLASIELVLVDAILIILAY